MTTNDSTRRPRPKQDLPKHPGVYAIIHIESGRRYIGSARDIYARWRWHKSDLRRGVSLCRYLQNAWTKYGESAFVFKVVEACLKDPIILAAREQHWIDQFKGNLFNIREQAMPAFGTPRTLEQKAAASERMMGNNHGYGTHYHGKLVEADIVEILYRIAAGEKRDDLAKEFETDPTHISRITSRTAWWRVQVPKEIDHACRERARTRGRGPIVCLPIPPRPEPPIPKELMPPKKCGFARKPKRVPEKIKTECCVCGKQMLVNPCRITERPRQYCSKDCGKIGMSISQKERFANPNAREHLASLNRGKHHSEETRSRMSESHKRRIQAINRPSSDDS